METNLSFNKLGGTNLGIQLLNFSAGSSQQRGASVSNSIASSVTVFSRLNCQAVDKCTWSTTSITKQFSHK